LQPEPAAAIKSQIGANDDLQDVKISTFPLGAIWDKLTADNGVATEEGGIEWRLVPNQTDLAFARNVTVQKILTTDFATEEEHASLLNRLSNGTTAEKEEARDEVEKIVSEKLGPLNANWGVIPVFTVSAMKMKIDDKEVRPWFLSREDCEQQWREAIQSSSDSPDELESLGGLHMTTLDNLVAS